MANGDYIGSIEKRYFYFHDREKDKISNTTVTSIVERVYFNFVVNEWRGGNSERTFHVRVINS